MYEPSKENQIIRWKSINSMYKNPEYLKCFVCFYENSINKFSFLLANDIFNFGTIKRYICPNCDVIFGDLKFILLPRDKIMQDYLDTYSYYKEGTNNLFFIELFKNIEYIKKNDKIIDYGCGNVLTYHKILNEQGYNIDRYDKFVKDPDMLQTIIPETYDILFNHNVIEHVLDPIADINDMKNCIKKNGYLVISSACWDYCYEYTHFHTFFFLGKSVNYLCEKLNIELMKTIKISELNDNVIIKIFKKL